MNYFQYVQNYISVLIQQESSVSTGNSTIDQSNDREDTESNKGKLVGNKIKKYLSERNFLYI